MNTTGKHIRVLVVDDSAVIRKLITDALAADPGIEVIGTAQNGALAVERVTALRPDAVTMDIDMPVMNGIEAVRAIRRTDRRLRIIMFSTLTERGASATLDALSAGANDYVTKPSNTSGLAQSLAHVREQLIPKLKALTSALPLSSAPSTLTPVPGQRPASSKPVHLPPAAGARSPRSPRADRIAAVVLGSSTGGPDALARVLPELPADFPLPILLVQHMPPVFTRLLSERLNKSCRLEVREAINGEAVVPGRILVAPGGRHMVVQARPGGVVVKLTDHPPENFCRPAVDVLFRSAVEVYADRLLAVVLTGMGRDGTKGAQAIRAAGGEIIAQDEASSVVWGMPGAIANAGLAHRILPLDQISADLVSVVTRATPAAVR